jgi:hypothetical protein
VKHRVGGRAWAVAPRVLLQTDVHTFGIQGLVLRLSIQVLENSPASLGSLHRAGELEMASAAVDANCQSLLDLPQMRVELTAKIRHTLMILGSEVDLQNGG